MPVTVTLEEEENSRRFNITEDSASQEFNFIICGDFLSEATEGASGLWNDDVIALQAAYDVLPATISLPKYQGGNALLSIASLELEFVDWEVWRAKAVYEVPKYGEGSFSDATGNEGPGSGENGGQGWSNNFTQVSCNLTATKRNRKFSKSVVATHRSTLLPAGGTPYTVGEPAPIGHTKDGIEGTDVYEREFSFQVTSYFPPSKLKYAYVRKLARMQTTLNDRVFFGFPQGSVLFLEADFSGDLYHVIPVTFSFHVRNNFQFSQSGPTKYADPEVDDPAMMYDIYHEPDFPTTGVHSGWVDVDYRYADIPDDTVKAVLQRPIFRILHLNYGFSNFGALEL